MPQTKETMTAWCKMLLGADPSQPKLDLAGYMNANPRLDSLADVPSGTTVLVRGDVDAKPGATVGEGDIRLRSMEETLKFGQERGWVQVIFGHIGRKPEGSLDKVANRIGEILGCDVTFIEDWVDPATNTVLDAASEQIKSAAPGSVIVLQNTRKYDIERMLWKKKADDLDGVVEPLATFANSVAEKIATVYVSEAFSAGNLDTSTCVIPSTMEKVALGKYVAAQFEEPIKNCVKAKMVVFSGLKIDKLDNLSAMMDQGSIKVVLAAGSVAMALKKADAQLAGGDFDLGMSEDPANSSEPYYIPPERIEQAKQMLTEGRENGVTFYMPIDFVLEDASISDHVGPGRQQFDVGPKSRENYTEAVTNFIETYPDGIVFYNGVFGMFEDARFEAGTKSFIPNLKRMTDAGIKVYVGGGEGGKALERYGEESWVTYNFTAGGTVLKALGGKRIPYLVALAAK
ncbi:MAG: phosphoglycerate kinase [Planctomycetia bacterium]|jgi:phosphoglycerate kinase